MSTIQENKVQSHFENDEVSLKDFFLRLKNWFKFLKLKLKIILYAGIIGALFGTVNAFIDKPVYKATLTFAMEDDKGSGSSGLSGAIGLASSFGIDLGGAGGGGAFAATNLAELMKSRLIVEKVLLEPVFYKGKNLTLIEYYIEKNNLRKKWSDKIHFPLNIDRNKFSLQQDSVLQLVHKKLINKDNLNILQKDKKVTILTIEVKSNDELFSKIFCESLAKETSDYYIQTKSKKARINVNVLQKQVDSVRYELNGAISGVASATDFVYNLNPALNIKSAPSKKRQIDVQANTAILTNLAVQLELAKITLRKETPLIQLIDKPILPLEKDKISYITSIILATILSMFITILYLTFGKLIKDLML